MTLFFPLVKADEERRLIYARATAEEIDKSKEILDYASAVPAFQKWSRQYADATLGKSHGNLRAQHDPRRAVGRINEIIYNDADKTIDVVAKVVDPVDWQKVCDGVYTGLSIGGGYAGKWPDPLHKGVTRYTPRISEISLVDAPCVNSARILEMQKADGSKEDVLLKGVPRSFDELQEPRTFDDLGKLFPLAGTYAGAVVGGIAGSKIGSKIKRKGDTPKMRRARSDTGGSAGLLLGGVGGTALQHPDLARHGVALAGWQARKGKRALLTSVRRGRAHVARALEHATRLPPKLEPELSGRAAARTGTSSFLGRVAPKVARLIRQEDAGDLNKSLPAAALGAAGYHYGGKVGSALGRKIGASISMHPGMRRVDTAEKIGRYTGHGVGALTGINAGLAVTAVNARETRRLRRQMKRRGTNVAFVGKQEILDNLAKAGASGFAQTLLHSTAAAASGSAAGATVAGLINKPPRRRRSTKAAKQEILDNLAKGPAGAVAGLAAGVVGAGAAVGAGTAAAHGFRKAPRHDLFHHAFGLSTLGPAYVGYRLGRAIGQRKPKPLATTNVPAAKQEILANLQKYNPMGVARAAVGVARGKFFGPELRSGLDRRAADRTPYLRRQKKTDTGKLVATGLAAGGAGAGAGVTADHATRKQEILDNLQKATPGPTNTSRAWTGDSAFTKKKIPWWGSTETAQQPRNRTIVLTRTEPAGDLAKASPEQRAKIAQTLHEHKAGTLRSWRGRDAKTGKPRKGPKVTNRQQAIAIAMSQARRMGKSEPAFVMALASRMQNGYA